MAGVNRYLGKPAPPPYVDEDDLLLLASDLGAGHHPASELYGWYVLAVKADGREPVTQKFFGHALREAGWTDSTQRRGDEGTPTRCWLITRPWVRRAEAEMAKGS